MEASDLRDELVRLSKPWNPQPLFHALDGRHSLYDLDAAWEPHHHGRPRSVDPGFDGACFLHGAQFLALAATRCPALRAERLALYEKMKQRLKNPKLLLYGGFPKGGYRYFCPATVTDAERTELRAATELSYPNDVYPWSSLFPAWEAFDHPGFQALVGGTEDADPRKPSAALVETVGQTLAIDEASATLLLQVLALADCGEAELCAVNGWTAAELKRAVSALVRAGHLVDKKQPRATRKFCLPGPWEALFAPHPALERWKLPLFGAELRGKGLAAPLGRLVPLKPLSQQFADAWQRFTADPPADAKKTPAQRDWIADIRAKPDDDAPRLVYADYLTEAGDTRGELIALQCRLARGPSDALAREEAALREKHSGRWFSDVHAFFEDVRWDRGFVTHVKAKPSVFVKGADAVFAAFPLLRGLVIHAAPPVPINMTQAKALAECPAFARFTELDTGVDHYFARMGELETLLGSKHFPQLKRLRIGYHRGGDGPGLALAEALAGCGALKGLEFLELDGQNLGRSAMNEARGTFALVTLLEALPALHTLRVPYNGFADAEARAIAKKLEDGLAPRLRVLDLSNEIDGEHLTKAVTFFRNQVSDDAAHAVGAVLAGRGPSLSA